MLHYALARPEPLVSPVWGTSAVVFDRRTGDTYLVNAASVLVLAMLRDSASGATEEGLGACLSDMASPEDREQVHEAVREALIELQKIRLVERLEGD